MFLDPGKIPGEPGKFDLTRSQRHLWPNFVGDTIFWNSPGSTQNFHRGSQEWFRTHFEAPELRSAAFSEISKFAHPGRLLPLLGVSRAHWTSPLGPPGLLYFSQMVRSTLPPFGCFDFWLGGVDLAFRILYLSTNQKSGFSHKILVAIGPRR